MMRRARLHFARLTSLLGGLLICATLTGCGRTADIAIGSKAFTESAILGEVLSQLATSRGYRVRHREQLGGTGLVWTNLLNGTIDAYADYTGTISKDILNSDGFLSEGEMRRALREFGVAMSHPLGFENSYELGMDARRAKELGVQKISDLKQYPELKLGFGPEFLTRPDGWKGLQAAYGLPHTDIASMEHALAYESVGRGEVDVIDIYGTDAKVKKFDLQILEDDLEYFPQYEAVVLYRQELEQRVPKFVEMVKRLESKVSHEIMLSANAQVDLDKAPAGWVANNLLAEHLQIGTIAAMPTAAERRSEIAQKILVATRDHLFLVAVSLILAIVVAVPLGVIAAKKPYCRWFILAFAEVVQTIPGLALLILLLAPLDRLGLPTLGPVPAIIALFLYSLLPVIRNTSTGIEDIPPAIRESATALGLSSWAKLWQIELPMASRMILAGIKTTAVINVGYATLGGLIGAGGYGEMIMQGLYGFDTAKMLQGAIPAALLAILVKYSFELLEFLLVPKGLTVGGAADA